MIEINALTPLEFNLSGVTSAYVSSFDSNTFIALSPFSTSSIKFGKSLYASGPHIKFL